MNVRDAMAARCADPRDPPEGPFPHLPSALRRDAAPARLHVLRRLSANRHFALGQKTGALRSAQTRSGRAFRADVRQRVIVKALVSRHVGAGVARAKALSQHLRYLGRLGAGADGARASFFDGAGEVTDVRARTATWQDDRHHFRFIVSPENGDRLRDLEDYVRETMTRVAEDLGQPTLDWLATCHFDTDQPHAHVLVRGRRANGRDLVIPRQYIAYGFRARAQEVAQERLGDLSRLDAERRVWRETQADRFTGFDRRLLHAAGNDSRLIQTPTGGDTWSALTRGRLLHLEKLGLAAPEGRGYRLASDLELRLRRLQIDRDVLRTLNARRLDGASTTRLLGSELVVGRVVQRGFHDELGASPFVIVRDAAGVEYYARLRAAATPPELGALVSLSRDARGLRLALIGQGRELGL